MMKIIRNLDNTIGMGWATIKQDTETGLYQGICSNGNSTRKYESLSDCVHAMEMWGYR